MKYTSICVARESIFLTLARFVRILIWRALVVRVENVEVELTSCPVNYWFPVKEATDKVRLKGECSHIK